MNWAVGWELFKHCARLQWRGPTACELEASAVRKARRIQLAEWTAARHEIDPIHKGK